LAGLYEVAGYTRAAACKQINKFTTEIR